MGTEASYKRLPPEERRHLLLQFAAEEIDLQRHLPISYDRIAERAGVTAPLLYNYFASDKGLYQGIARMYLDQLATVLAESDRKIDQAITIYFDFVLDHGSALSVILSDPTMRDGLPQDTRQSFIKLILPYAKLIKHITGCPPRDAVLALLTYLAIPEDLARNSRDGKLDTPTARQYAQDLAHMALRALKRNS